MQITNLTESQWNELLNAWREVNDAGEGDAFEGAETMADVIDHPEVVLLAERDNQALIQIVTALDPHRVLMVCNANGPWVCDVNSAFRLIEAKNNFASGVYPR